MLITNIDNSVGASSPGSGGLASGVSRSLSSFPPITEPAVRLRIVRGPLTAGENESILAQYKSLASADISFPQFLRWIQDSPEGPAWHAILETPEGEIVGHTSLIPMRASYDGRSFIAAKSEYSFIREEYRAAKIRGFEQTGRLKNLIYVDELFRRCRAEGWSPLLISTPSGFHRVFRSIACYPVNFPVQECLLVLRPREAALRTPNIYGWHRAFLWGAGLAQRAFWSPAFLSPDRENQLSTITISGDHLRTGHSRLTFFQDRDSLDWRYPESEYEQIAMADGNGGGNLLVKYGSATRYLRVCQWQLDCAPSRGLIASLVRKARRQGALGVRWAVYGEDAASGVLVQRLRKLGFVCVRRPRTLLINTANQEFLDPRKWNLTDAMFTFDL